MYGPCENLGTYGGCQSPCTPVNQLVTSYTYDPQGRVLTETDPPTTGAVTGTEHTEQTSYTYDTDGDVLTTVESDLTGGDPSRTSTNVYNADDQLSSATDPAAWRPATPTTPTATWRPRPIPRRAVRLHLRRRRRAADRDARELHRHRPGAVGAGRPAARHEELRRRRSADHRHQLGRRHHHRRLLRQRASPAGHRDRDRRQHLRRGPGRVRRGRQPDLRRHRQRHADHRLHRRRGRPHHPDHRRPGRPGPGYVGHPQRVGPGPDLRRDRRGGRHPGPGLLHLRRGRGRAVADDSRVCGQGSDYLVDV